MNTNRLLRKGKELDIYLNPFRKIETTTTTPPDFLEVPYSAYSSAAAESLPKNGSLFCWVLTSPKYFQTRVSALKRFSPSGKRPKCLAFSALNGGFISIYSILCTAMKFIYCDAAKEKHE